MPVAPGIDVVDTVNCGNDTAAVAATGARMAPATSREAIRLSFMVWSLLRVGRLPYDSIKHVACQALVAQ
ncbi:MAG: hypothetical protein A3E25_08755 [Burkholderiales bacterium RIFCSPHIGHO2_12_FULL_69_20]|nr:MAG: hypothetical protein A3E25_08755 [Burkholderiales bacterium RIFCSPHIGHO2_12_FULL_69_20]